MARYQVILAYDGKDFHGSQRQADHRTVQSVVEAALRKLNWAGQTILFAGRTDAGVHASGQVVSFDLDWNHPSQNLQNALNAMLPVDVAVTSLKQVSPDFHPRYDAVSRCYRYRLYCQPVRDPLRERYAWQVWPVPEMDRLQSAAEMILGIHDFASFGGPTRPGGSTFREISQASWQQMDDEFIFDITGNAFLYHMVRRLVFAMVAVGQGKLEAADIRRHLQNPQGPALQGLAPPNGLTLSKIDYPPAGSENID